MGELISFERARARRGADAERLLTKQEMARDIGVSPRTLDKYAQDGLVPFELMKVSHRGTMRRRYRRSDVRRALGLPPG